MSDKKEQEKKSGSAVATFLAAVAGGVCVYFAVVLPSEAKSLFQSVEMSLSQPTQLALQDPVRALVAGVGLVFVLGVSIHRIATGKLARISWPLALVTIAPALYYAVFLEGPYRDALSKLIHGQ